MGVNFVVCEGEIKTANEKRDEHHTTHNPVVLMLVICCFLGLFFSKPQGLEGKLGPQGPPGDPGERVSGLT